MFNMNYKSRYYENRREKLFKERIPDNFPEFMTDVNLQI